MAAHTVNARVAQHGCFALLIIAALSAGLQAAVDAGAPAAIVAAMTAHTVSVAIMRKAAVINNRACVKCKEHMKAVDIARKNIRLALRMVAQQLKM